VSKGLDVGTMNLVSASTEKGGQIKTSRIRNVFLDLPRNAKKLIKLSGASFIEGKDSLLIVGDNAFDMANMFGRVARRPLSQGIVSNNESNAIDVLGYMIKTLLGEPSKQGEVCYFSVPAPPIDNPSKDIVYHKRLFERIINECGYTAFPSNEAMAVIFSECESTNFSGIGFSFGSGMTNVALANLSMECLSFSCERGGDWIDSGASKAVGVSQISVCLEKEKGIDLLNPKNRTQEAISFYYKELIEYAVDVVVSEFNRKRLNMTITKPLPIIVSGGTSKAGNFLEFFSQVISKKKLPFDISEIKHASDPYNAVAVGLLIQANAEE